MGSRDPHSDRPWDERMQELYAFLTEGTLPDRVTVGRWRTLSKSAAMTLIWFLQERTDALPDNYDQCCRCKCLFDTEREGHYNEKKCQHYCGDCDHLDRT